MDDLYDLWNQKVLKIVNDRKLMIEFSLVFFKVVLKTYVNRKRDKFTKGGLRKFLEGNHNEATIFPLTNIYMCIDVYKYLSKSILRKNFGEQTL